MSQQKEKSNAPWILGIIGLFLTILHFACAFLCSAGLAVTKVATEGEAAGDKMMEAGMGVTYLVIGIMVLCFILSFFGKSKLSRATGVLMILGGIVAGALSCVYLSIPGLAAGFVYLFGGISSINNYRRV